MKSDVKRIYNRFKKLKQYKDKSKEFIVNKAQLEVWKKQVDIESKFLKDTDKDYAKKLFNDYISNYEFDSYSDLNTLADLVYEEVLKKNIQRQVNEVYSDESNNYVPDKLIKSLHDTEERVLDLKTKLKIGVDDNKEEDELTALEKLKKRFFKYIPFNCNEFTMVCSSCGELQLLRRKTKNFKVLKHPFFAGRFYYNRRAIELVKAGVISKEVYAFILNVNVEFVTWCLEHEDEIPKIDGLTQQEVKEFIQKLPYLKKEKIPKNIK
ncbi:MAG: hypothetical protein ACTSWG_10525 [Candidatus Helarchaeota archaeon]